jgi:COP9 signalosome complex subunit 7
VLLAKSAKGAAASELIRQVLEAPGVYVFGELLEMQNITEVQHMLGLIKSNLFFHHLL